MVTGGDKDVMAFLTGDYIAYVCFEKDEDTFMILSISSPVELLYTKGKSRLLESQPSMAYYQQFKNGVGHGFEVIGGKWQRSTIPSEKFISDPQDEAMSLDDSEITYSETFENLRKSKTNHSITVRRSTLRFAETFRFPADDNKTTNNYENTGHCVRY